MKYFRYGLCVILLLLAPMLTLAASLSTVQVRVTGISSNQGVVRIAMFNTPQAFADKNSAAVSAFQKGIARINGSTAVYTFNNVPYGVYAIKLYHDEDNSGQLKRNFFGKPQEGFGVSNNPRITNQPPTFDQAKFAVSQSRVNMTIQMINP